MRSLNSAAAFTADPSSDTHWVEHLRVESLSLGTYSIRAGGLDTQVPHHEDEVYVVTAGAGWFEAAGDQIAVEPGSTIFVPAHEEHRFFDVTEDLAVIVLFAPAESGD